MPTGIAGIRLEMRIVAEVDIELQEQDSLEVL